MIAQKWTNTLEAGKLYEQWRFPASFGPVGGWESHQETHSVHTMLTRHYSSMWGTQSREWSQADLESWSRMVGQHLLWLAWWYHHPFSWAPSNEMTIFWEQIDSRTRNCKGTEQAKYCCPKRCSSRKRSEDMQALATDAVLRLVLCHVQDKDDERPLQKEVRWSQSWSLFWSRPD